MTEEIETKSDENFNSESKMQEVVKQLLDIELKKKEDLQKEIEDSKKYFNGYDFNETQLQFIKKLLVNPNLTNKEMARLIERSEIQVSRIRNDAEVVRFFENYHKRFIDNIDSVVNKGLVILDELATDCISTKRGGRNSIKDDKFRFEVCKFLVSIGLQLGLLNTSNSEAEELAPSQAN